MANFRVVIAGGGITGLTLANALQHANIDYVLLEGRDDIGSHWAGGVGLDAPAARILDQLGIFSDLENQFVGSAPTKEIFFRNSDGKCAFVTTGVALCGVRTGYPSGSFHKRRQVLETMYKYIQDKEKVLLNKRVRSIAYVQSKPVVTCEDGSSYSGDIVVGCDGVHSKVRGEMWRLTDEEKPGKIPSTDKDFLTANYRALYMISGPAHGLETENIQVVTGINEAGYGMVTKDGTTMWGLLEKLDEEYHLPNIPRYTDEDARSFAESKLDMVLVSDTAQVKFGDLWPSRLKVNLVAIEEGDLKVWTSGRIICIGDSVHKVTAESGIGSTIATESAASLANYLKRLVDNSTDKVPGSAEIEACLSEFEAHRHPRASVLVKRGLMGVRLFTLANSTIRFLVNWVIPYIGRESGFSEVFIGAERIEFLPIPSRSLKGTMAFNPTQGLGQEEPLRPRAILALPLLLMALIAWRTKEALTLDTQLQTLPLYLIWLMEGNRRAYAAKLVQLTLPISLLSYFFGVATLTNVWFFLHYFSSPIEIFAAWDQRLLRMNYAKTLLPTILLGAIVPAIIVTMYPEAELSNKLQVLWPILPIVLAITHRVLASLVEDTTPFDKLYRVKADLPFIRWTVRLLAFASAATFQYLNTTKTGSAFPAFSNLSSIVQHLEIIDIGAMIWLILLFKDLKKARMLENSWVLLLAGYIISILVTGPGATLLNAWLWREEILATKRHWAAVTQVE